MRSEGMHDLLPWYLNRCSVADLMSMSHPPLVAGNSVNRSLTAMSEALPVGDVVPWMPL